MSAYTNTNCLDCIHDGICRYQTDYNNVLNILYDDRDYINYLNKTSNDYSWIEVSLQIKCSYFKNKKFVTRHNLYV